MTVVRKQWSPEGAVDILVAEVDLNRSPAPTEAERAAQVVLSAADFYVALASSSVIDMAGAADPEAWLVAQIDTSPLDAATKAVASILARKATQFHRADPERPGLMAVIAAILPRADGGIGMTTAEIDALFLTASGDGSTP